MEDITQLINTVGFPIVACIFMYIQNMKLTGMILELNTTLKGIDTRLEHIERGNE